MVLRHCCLHAAVSWIAGGIALAACADPAPRAGARVQDASPAAAQGGAPPDWLGIIGTGQSLSVGFDSTVQETAPQPAGLKLADSANVYDITHPDAATLSLVPTSEPQRPLSGGTLFYPGNIFGETPHTSLARNYAALAAAAGVSAPVTVHSAVGASSQPMAAIAKGGTGNPYAASLFEAAAAARLAAAAGKRLAYGAVLLTHGEADEQAGNTAYAAALLQLYHDYNADLRLITGQTSDVPLLLSQQHSEPGTSAIAVAPVTQAQWRAGLDYPGQIVVIGPKYQYAYSDVFHLQGPSYRAYGAKVAEVLHALTVQRRPWRPLQPLRAQLTAPTLIRVAFDVPFPPLAWDTALAPPHQAAHTEWANGRGFEVVDAQNSPLTIASVTLDAGGSQLEIALANPAALPLTLQYAMTQDSATPNGGTQLGRRGQLRDSDPFQATDAERLLCQVTNSRAEIFCPAGLGHQAATHVADPGGYSLTSVNLPAAGYASLARPWRRPSGVAALSVHSNQYNYCVAFSMAVAAP